MRILVKGAGDIATGTALRLWNGRFQVVMTDLPAPTTLRRKVSFSQAVLDGSVTVEGVRGIFASSLDEVANIWDEGAIPVLADPEASCLPMLKPDVVIDAILAKRNLGTTIEDAPLVIGLGPGFTAGTDCHAVVETNRGHDLGRVIIQGSAAPDTGIPGEIGGHSERRVLRAPAGGVFRQELEIGSPVRVGEVVGTVAGVPMVSKLDGILRGVLTSGILVREGMKCGDVDPRGEAVYCHTVSDKARAIGGGVLEAILRCYPGTITLP